MVGTGTWPSRPRRNTSCTPPDQDNPENRILVRAVLDAAGYAVVNAEDGLAGIEAAVRESRP